jgi:hypothetical protein
MEVHHHPDLHHNKKKFMEYFLEFLMIFLAVTMGFFAESLRENISNREKGKEYVKSFIEDLQADTSQYNKLIIQFAVKDSLLGKISDCFDTLNGKITVAAGLNSIIQSSFGFPDFIYTDRTIQQVKIAGGLKLIHNKSIADSILFYDSKVKADLIHQEGMEKFEQETINAHISMVGFKQFSKLYSKNYLQASPVVKLLTGDTREINSYFNRIWVFKSNCLGQLNRLKYLRMTAARLIIFLQEKESK